MPVAYRILDDLNLVVTTWSGDVTLDESQRHNRDLRSDPTFRADMRQLSDARLARSQVPAEGIRGLARTSPFGPEARRSILVSDDETFGVSRMYEAQATEAGAVAVFRDRAEALSWLGLGPGDVPEAPGDDSR